MALGYGNVNAAEFCRILGGATLSLLCACVSLHPPLPAEVLFCVFQRVIGWLDLQILALMEDQCHDHHPMYFQLMLHPFGDCWRHIDLEHHYLLEVLNMHGSLSYPLVLENIPSNLPRFQAREKTAYCHDQTVVGCVLVRCSTFKGSLVFSLLAYHWRNWNADMFIHFNPVSVCLVEVAESTDYLFDWYIDNMMLYDMIWYGM